VIAVLGGLGAALMWAGTTLCSSRSARMIGPRSVLSWVMIVGSLIVVPWVVAVGIPDELDAPSAAWLVVSGAGNVVGLLLTYAALRIGKVGVIAPIVSTEGAIAAVIAVAAGEHIAVGAGAMLVLIAAGIVLAGAARGAQPRIHAPRERDAIFLATAAAACFGLGLYSTGRVSVDLPVAWALLPARVIGLVAVAAPLALTSGLRLTRPALPLVVAGGVFEVAGFACYALGARHGIAVSAVLASQFGGIAALAGFALFRERLARIQVVGVTAIVVGVAVLSGIQAG
jgi:drug/metabolite transporter (DMT)-like permease